MSLTMIIILAIGIIAVSFVEALTKVIGAGGNVKDFFPKKKKSCEGKITREDSKANEGKTA